MTEWTKDPTTGEPVYWLDPPYWDRHTGVRRLVLEGENPHTGIPLEVKYQRQREFLLLSGQRGPQRERMLDTMCERLGDCYLTTNGRCRRRAGCPRTGEISPPRGTTTASERPRPQVNAGDARAAARRAAGLDQ